VEKYGPAIQITDDKIQCMHLACRIKKARDMLRIFGTSCFSRETMVTQTHFNVTFVSTLLVLFDSYPLFRNTSVA
jgi:DMSO reductase anchor subunit